MSFREPVREHRSCDVHSNARGRGRKRSAEPLGDTVTLDVRCVPQTPNSFCSVLEQP